MSQPRQILPGATLLITRDIVGRQFLLAPDKDINALILYALAVYAPRFSIQVHAFCAMSSHIHAVVTDQLGKLPKFTRCFHRAIALGVNKIRNRSGTVWENKHTSVVQLLTPNAIVEKIAYTIANPVAAGLVEHAEEWAGAKVCVSDILRGEIRVARPASFFSAKSKRWPAQAALEVSLPPGISAEEADMFHRQLAAELARRGAVARGDAKAEEEEAEEIDTEGTAAAPAAERVIEISPEDRAKSKRPKIGRNPTFAIGRNAGEELRARVVDALRAFRGSYRAALVEWCKKTRDIVFPAGTWWMLEFHKASVCPAAPAPL